MSNAIYFSGQIWATSMIVSFYVCQNYFGSSKLLLANELEKLSSEEERFPLVPNFRAVFIISTQFFAGIYEWYVKVNVLIFA